jgi:hypothetical protein
MGIEPIHIRATTGPLTFLRSFNISLRPDSQYDQASLLLHDDLLDRRIEQLG